MLCRTRSIRLPSLAGAADQQDLLGLTGSVTWTGLLTGDLKVGRFRAADVFALTSHQENFGIAVAEALACGLPVLMSNQVNIWREIDEDRAGFIENETRPGHAALLQRWMALDEATRCAMRTSASRCFADASTSGTSDRVTLHSGPSRDAAEGERA